MKRIMRRLWSVSPRTSADYQAKFARPALRACFCIIMAVLCGEAAHGALDEPLSRYTHRVWQSNEGDLPQASVAAIAQTPDGYLWVGTEEGLARYDGARFVVFDKRGVGLPDNMIQALLVDSGGGLWIGTRSSGLARLKDGLVKTFNRREGLPNEAIRRLYQDKSGVIWIGTDGGGLIEYQNGTFRAFTKHDGLPDNTIVGISSDASGNLWVATPAGAARLNNGRITAYPFAYKSIDSVSAVLVTHDNALWFGTVDGLFRVADDRTIRFSTRDGLPNNYIHSLYEDSSGALWIGTANGLSRYCKGHFASFTEREGMSAKEISSIFEDREHNLWVGTLGGGLNLFTKGSFSTITTAHGLTANTILPVLEDKDGAMWLGSDQGLMKLTDGQVVSYTTREGLPDNLVFSLTQDHAGVLWIGTRKGIAWLKGKKITPFRPKNLAGPVDYAMSAYTDRSGNVWIGAKHGLIRIDSQGSTIFTTRQGLSSDFVSSIAEDSQGTLWFGTIGGGLNRFKDGQFTAFTTHDGLGNNSVWALYCDSDGTIWIGTNGGGLTRLRDGKFTTVTTAAGLFDDSVLSILDDGRGFLWMSSDKGVFRISKRELTNFASGKAASVTSVVYDTADGMMSRECDGGFQPAGWRTRDGRLWFPTTKGVSIADPSRLSNQGFVLSAVLERALVNGKDVRTNAAISNPVGKGQLEFQFTAPSFIAPNKIDFEYMLEGFDKEWVRTAGRRSAFYTNIPPGEYHFRVRAGTEGHWTAAEQGFSVTLEPHFYQTRIFYAMLLICSFSICAGAYRLRVRALKHREGKLLALVDERTAALQASEHQLRQSRDELEIRVKERTSDLVHANAALEAEVQTRRQTEELLILAKNAAEAASRAKSDFLANMSHEIRTPINGIIGMTEITLTTELTDEQREYLEIVKVSADSLLGIVNDILDFSKIEARKLTLDRTQFHLGQSIRELIRSLSLRARQKNLTLTAEIAPRTPLEVVGDPLRLRQVLLNLLDNAIKFTGQGGITLNVYGMKQTAHEAWIRFSVRDTGIGIPPEKRRTIFEAFTQADTSSTRRYGGTGLGLTISYQLVAMMGGQLLVESEQGAGSTFQFTAKFVLPDAPEAADCTPEAHELDSAVPV